MKLAYWDEDAYVRELTVSAGDVPTPAKSSKLPSAEKEGLVSMRDAEKSRKRKAETAAAPNVKKSAASHLQFWSNRHAELHGLDQKPTQSKTSEDSKSTRDTSPPSQSYADPERNCCYLCSRQFNSAAEVNKHERLSDLHCKNLKDPALVSKAQAKLEKHAVLSQETSLEYRDRAKERRKVYGVVNKKGEQIGHKAKPPAEADQPVVQSKGASLLSKMGYTAGQGLGVSGEGRTAPINQDVYAAGVGLGAQGGKLGDAVVEAARRTKDDYSGFAEKTRETARERYSRM